MPIAAVGALLIGAAGAGWVQQLRLNACRAEYGALKTSVNSLAEAADRARARAERAEAAARLRVDEAKRRAKAAEDALTARTHKDESCEDGVDAALQQWRSRP
mgnify:CR=1 FL=1